MFLAWRWDPEYLAGGFVSHEPSLWESFVLFFRGSLVRLGSAGGRPGRLWISHPTHLWCIAHRAAHAASLVVNALILRIPARPCRAGKGASDLRRSRNFGIQLNALETSSPGLSIASMRLASHLRRRQSNARLRRTATARVARRNCVGGATPPHRLAPQASHAQSLGCALPPAIAGRCGRCPVGTICGRAAAFAAPIIGPANIEEEARKRGISLPTGC